MKGYFIVKNSFVVELTFKTANSKASSQMLIYSENF